MFLFIYNPPANIPSFVTGDLDDVSSPIFPLLLTALLSFAVASFFLSVYETAIDTILLCFCEDCQVNKTSGTYYMSDELLSFVDGAAKKNAFRQYKVTTSTAQEWGTYCLVCEMKYPLSWIITMFEYTIFEYFDSR